MHVTLSGALAGRLHLSEVHWEAGCTSVWYAKWHVAPRVWCNEWPEWPVRYPDPRRLRSPLRRQVAAHRVLSIDFGITAPCGQSGFLGTQGSRTHHHTLQHPRDRLNGPPPPFFQQTILQHFAWADWPPLTTTPGLPFVPLGAVIVVQEQLRDCNRGRQLYLSPAAAFSAPGCTGSDNLFIYVLKARRINGEGSQKGSKVRAGKEKTKYPAPPTPPLGLHWRQSDVDFKWNSSRWRI